MPEQAVSDSQLLVIRGIEAVEGTKGQLAAMEKSIDGMESTVRSSAEVAKRAGDALERIAKAEEERNRIAADASKHRADLFSRAWSSPPVQLLILLAICGLAQLVGLRWVVENYIPKPVPAAQIAMPESP